MSTNYSLYTTSDREGNSLTTYVTGTLEAPTDRHIPTSIEKTSVLKHNAVVYAVAISEVTEHIYTCDKYSIKTWNYPKSPVVDQPLSSIKCFNGDKCIKFCKLLADNRTMLVGGSANTIVICDLLAVTGNDSSTSSTHSSTSPAIKGKLKLNAPACNSVAVNPSDSKICYCCCSDGAIAIYDIHHQSLVKSFVGHADGTSCIDITTDGRTIWTGGLDNIVRCWDIRNDYRSLQEYKFDSNILKLGWCPTDQWLAVGMKSGKVELINISSSTTTASNSLSPSLKTIDDKYTFHLYEDCLYEDCLQSLKFAHNGKWFLVAGVTFNASYRQTPNGLPLFESKESSSVLCCDISDSDQYVVTGAIDETAKVYKLNY